jgi:hypothetical protein
MWKACGIARPPNVDVEYDPSRDPPCAQTLVGDVTAKKCPDRIVIAIHRHACSGVPSCCLLAHEAEHAQQYTEDCARCAAAHKRNGSSVKDCVTCSEKACRVAAEAEAREAGCQYCIAKKFDATSECENHVAYCEALAHPMPQPLPPECHGNRPDCAGLYPDTHCNCGEEPNEAEYGCSGFCETGKQCGKSNGRCDCMSPQQPIGGAGGPGGNGGVGGNGGIGGTGGGGGTAGTGGAGGTAGTGGTGGTGGAGGTGGTGGTSGTGGTGGTGGAGGPGGTGGTGGAGGNHSFPPPTLPPA